LKKNKKKIVLIIDEFSYLIELSKAMPSVFQKYGICILKTEMIFILFCVVQAQD